MALTPEDVVNKRFNPTKFREGYDQDEVDDFLDEVVVELRRLGQENEELRQRLVAADSRISELQRSASQAPVMAPPPAAAPEVVQQVAPVPAPIPAPAPAADFGQDQASMDQSNTNNLLQLARRLHEEHVREGMEKRDELIAEGHATAARIVSEAETQGRAAVEALESERSALARKVEELSIFESSYREQLHSYIETQLRELENSTPIAGESDAAADVSAAPVTSTFGAPAGDDFASAPAPTFGESAAPAYAAPVSAAPVYGEPVAPAPEAPSTSSGPVYAAPFGDFSQAPAPQPGNASAPPAYAGFPAPQVTPEFPAPPADEQSSQQPQYPGFPPRSNEYPGFGGN